jgi:hypothetical protein
VCGVWVGKMLSSEDKVKYFEADWIRTEKGADSILSITHASREVAQLRRPGKKPVRKYWAISDLSKQGEWSLHPVHLTDDILNDLFGVNWRSETYNGFITVADFRRWLKGKEC